MIVSLGIALVLGVLGALFLFAPKTAFEKSGHEERALPGIMGGRYLAFACVIAILSAFGEWRALAVIFAVGTAMALLDAFLTLRASGRVAPHLGAGIACAVALWLCLDQASSAGPAS
jgi:hypothetical protein